MRINKDKVIEELGLKYFGAKGWMSSDETACPVCGRKDKFGILFTPTGGVTHCFYNCSDNMSLGKYLRHIKREDLILYSNGHRVLMDFSISKELKIMERRQHGLLANLKKYLFINGGLLNRLFLLEQGLSELMIRLLM